MSAFDRAYDWATTGRETRPKYALRVAADALWAGKSAASRRWRHMQLCPRCNGGGLVAPGDWCPHCGGSGEVERGDAQQRL